MCQDSVVLFRPDAGAPFICKRAVAASRLNSGVWVERRPYPTLFNSVVYSLLVMILGIRFATFRLIIPILLVASQVYLFIRIRRAVTSSDLSSRSKSWIVPLAAVIIGSLFVMNGFILARHIPWVDPPVQVRALLFYLPAVWGFGSVLSAVFLFLSSGLRRITRRIVRETVFPRPDPDRRRILQAGVAGLAVAPFLLSGYGAVWESKACEVRTLSVPFGRALRVVQISDIHAGVYMTRKEIRGYADRVMALQPDLFVLTGDFISNSVAYLSGCIEEIARVQTRYGTFATLGNHENWYRRQRGLGTVFEKYGVRLLVNTHEVVETAQGSFAVAGIDDLRTGFPDLETALRGLTAGIPTLLLSHRPEIFPRAAGHRIPLTLAGHWHGGQIQLRVPGVTISPAHLLTPYPEGLYRINASHLYVSRGIGTTFTPVRLNAPPEITVIHLT